MPPVVFHAAKKGGKYVNGPCLNFPPFSRASRIQIAGKNAKLECLIDCRVSAKNSPKRGARREGEIEPLLIAAELGSLHNFAKLQIAVSPCYPLRREGRERSKKYSEKYATGFFSRQVWIQPGSWIVDGKVLPTFEKRMFHLPKNFNIHVIHSSRTSFLASAHPTCKVVIMYILEKTFSGLFLNQC